jgi:CD109 antigen
MKSFLFSTELQSDAGEGVALTAHVLLAFLSLPNAATKYSEPMKKATDYIVERLKSINHLYSLALAAYALQKAGHASASDVLKRLDKAAIEKDGLKCWEYYPSNDNQYYWWYYTNSVNIQITSIALMTYADAGLETGAFPILQWLIKQRNSRGGYYSTQDTILGIGALAKMASKLFVSNQDIDVKVLYGTDEMYNVKVDRDNAIALQSYELPLDTKKITFKCKGRGFAVAQVAYKYHVIIPEPAPRFKLDITIRDSTTKTNLVVTICTSFIVDDMADKSSMAIVEVAFPSGYTFNRDTLDKLRITNDVSVIIQNIWKKFTKIK